MYKFFILLIISTLTGKLAGAEVLGIGAPIIDLILHVDDDFLEEHIPGAKGGGCRPGWDRFCKILQEAPGDGPLLATGGSCSNTIKGLASLGVSTSLLGKRGNDAMGEFFVNKITPLGIEPHLLLSETPNAQVMCLVTPDKNRTFVVFPGAGDEISREDLSDHFFDGIRHLHVDGYMLHNGPLIEEAMKRAKERGATVSFDLATFHIVRQFHERILSLLKNYVDIVFANQDEAKALVGAIDEKACQLMLAYCPTVVILAGAEGCIVGTEEEILKEPTIQVTVVDTTGAGDLFASGFLFGYLNGEPLRQCARLGNLLGTTVVTVNGAEIPPHKWEMIRWHLRDDRDKGL